MAGEWQMQPQPLGELTINHDGKRRPVKGADRKLGPYPYYGASGIVDYVDEYLIDGDYLLIAEDGENLRTRQTPIAFMARGKSWVNNHAHIVTGNDKADTLFLMYALQATDISGYLTGAVMPKLTQGNLNKIQITCPSIDEQHAIAYILGTLDDKIELNRPRLRRRLRQRNTGSAARLHRRCQNAGSFVAHPLRRRRAGNVTTTLMLDLPQKHLQQVQALLREYAPDAEVWAYGSRVTGGGHEASDLDLVLRNPDDLREESRALYDIKEAFTESDLPIRVDVMDWARIPESFHREIERAHVVVQEGRK